MPVFVCTHDINYTNGEYKTKGIKPKMKKIFKRLYDKVEAIQKCKIKTITYGMNKMR